MDRRKRLLSNNIGIATSSNLRYLVNDSFSSNLSAGSVHNTLSEPGPGTRRVVDTENKLSISGGKLQCASGRTTPTTGDPGAWWGPFVRAIGRGLFCTVNAATVSSVQIGYDNSSTGSPIDGLVFSSTLRAKDGSITSDALNTFTLNTDYRICIMPKGSGCNLLIKGGPEFPNWTLVWVTNTSTDTPFWLGACNYTATFSLDEVKVIDLPSPWNTDYGIATQRLAGNVAQGATFTHEANCLIEWTQTTLSADTGSIFRFRAQDATNYWDVRTLANGGFELREYAGGVPTVRGSASAGTVLNGHRCVLVFDGATIKGYSNNILRWTYSSATTSQTATNGRLQQLGSGAVVSDIVSWPRTISGTALNALNKV
jgi:hypothetical protein